MITSEQYKVLDRHREVLVRWNMGYRVSLSKEEWDDLTPIVRSAGFSVGQRGCGACVLSVCRHCYGLLVEYEDGK